MCSHVAHLDQVRPHGLKVEQQALIWELHPQTRLQGEAPVSLIHLYDTSPRTPIWLKQHCSKNSSSGKRRGKNAFIHSFLKGKSHFRFWKFLALKYITAAEVTWTILLLASVMTVTGQWCTVFVIVISVFINWYFLGHFTSSYIVF